MHPFEFYLKLGFEHIANLNGYDHILFLIVLCAVYQIKHWRKILILVTALHNIMGTKQMEINSRMGGKYFMALFFGLIHGMDFSNYFRALIMSSDEIVIPLLGFNIGIELGQLLIVFFIVLISFIFLNIIKVKHYKWNLFISGAAFGTSLISILEISFNK